MKIIPINYELSIKMFLIQLSISEWDQLSAFGFFNINLNLVVSQHQNKDQIKYVFDVESLSIHNILSKVYICTKSKMHIKN
ncbi:Gustatory receptor [Aphis craccivora]|uniref:Gustatory receptor n=1 Tax=Aphis craccivora TaxID=307492 RepID=A0A6G0W1M8_APHCR|nr:Gustatory receptor [Aphis craccivora]